MAHLVEFSRNRCTSVEQVAESCLQSTCRLQDNLMDAQVCIQAGLPGLEITSISCQVDRARPAIPPDAQQKLQKLLGVKVGPGMLKIVKGLIGDQEAYAELGFMVEECCHGVILSLTKTELAKAPLEPEDSREHFAAMVRKSTRLMNRCAAFAPGSSLVEGIQPRGDK